MGYFASVLFRMICLPNLKRKILLFFFIIRQGYLQKWSVPREVGKITVRWESPPFAVSGDVQDLIGVFLKKYIASKQAKQFLFIKTLCYLSYSTFIRIFWSYCMQNVAALVMLYMTLKVKPGTWYKTGQANGALSLSPSDFCPVDVCLPYFHFCVMLSYLLLLELGMYPQHVLLINSYFLATSKHHLD